MARPSTPPDPTIFSPLDIVWDEIGLERFTSGEYPPIEHARQFIGLAGRVQDRFWEAFEEGFPPEIIRKRMEFVPPVKTINHWLETDTTFSARYLQSFPIFLASMPGLKARLAETMATHQSGGFGRSVQALLKILDSIEDEARTWRNLYRLPTRGKTTEDTEMEAEDARFN